MEQQTARICLVLMDRGPENGVHTLNTAAKVLSELQAGKQNRDLSTNWKLAPSDCGSDQGIVLCGQVLFRSQWQLQAYLDYIQNRICDMIDNKKISFRLQMGNCQ